MRDYCYHYNGEKRPTFDEKLKQGQSMKDGLAGAMPLREEHEKPWTQRQHKTTRSEA